MTALRSELSTLKAQWAESEAAARLAANQAAIVPPADLPVPTPAVGPKGEDESDYDYQQRQLANIRAQAQARWNSGAPPLLTEIDNLKTQIETAQTEIDTAVETFVSATYLDYFINDYGGNDTVRRRHDRLL